MLIFDTGIKLLLLSLPVFFLVFFYLCYSWAKPEHPQKSVIIGIAVSILYSFLFFLIGFILIVVISLIWQYLGPFIQQLSF